MGAEKQMHEAFRSSMVDLPEKKNILKKKPNLLFTFKKSLIMQVLNIIITKFCNKITF